MEPTSTHAFTHSIHSSGSITGSITDQQAAEVARRAVARAIDHYTGHGALLCNGELPTTALSVALYLVDEVEALGYTGEWPRNFIREIETALVAAGVPVEEHDEDDDTIDPHEVDGMAEDMATHRHVARLNRALALAGAAPTSAGVAS